jgi:hypothetical protein
LVAFCIQADAVTISTDVALNDNERHKIKIIWTKASPSDTGGTMLVKDYDTIIAYSTTQIQDYSTTDELWIGSNGASRWGKFEMCGLKMFDFKVTEAELDTATPTYYLPMAEGDGTSVFNVVSDLDYTLTGTINSSTRTLQNEYHYNINDGFGASGSTYLPASQLNVGFDVLGNTLTNPQVDNFHNNAETSDHACVNLNILSINTNTSFHSTSLKYSAIVKPVNATLALGPGGSFICP